MYVSACMYIFHYSTSKYRFSALVQLEQRATPSDVKGPAWRVRGTGFRA